MEDTGVSVLILTSGCVSVTIGDNCSISCAMFACRSNCAAKIAGAILSSWCIRENSSSDSEFGNLKFIDDCRIWLHLPLVHMFYSVRLVLLATLSFYSRCLASELVLYDLHTFPYARCLDGSPSGYYLRPATSKLTASKFLVILEGGGMCTGREDCTDRL